MWIFTFHFHDSIVRNVVGLLFLLRLCPSLVVLLRGDNDYGLAGHAFEGPDFTFLGVRVHVGLKSVQQQGGQVGAQGEGE